MPTKKVIITKKGRLKDGRSRYVIQHYEDGKKRLMAIPIPEELKKILETHKKLGLMRGKVDT